MSSFTLKSGTNKGNRRIWIEGNRLTDAGFTRCTGLYRTVEGNRMTLTTRQIDGAKRHRIAGTVARPILDLCGKWVTEFMGDHTHFTATTITIEPVSL